MFQIQFEEVGGGGGNEEEGKQRRQDGCSQDSCELEAGKTGGCCEVGSDQTSVTITGADPSKSYDVSVTGVTGGGVGETAPITVPEAEKEEEGGGGSGFPIAAVLGVVVAVVVVALVAVIVAIIIVLYRRTSVTLHYTCIQCYTHTHTHTYTGGRRRGTELTQTCLSQMT